jgi:hypothetical protein
MRKKRFLVLSSVILLAALLAGLFAPVTLSTGVRLWFWWQARKQGLHVELGKIDTPFLRPIVIHHLHISDGKDVSLHIAVDADRIVLGLNIPRILTGIRGRAIRSLSIDKARVQISRNFEGKSGSPHLAWTTLESLLPENFDLADFNLRIEDGTTTVQLRNASISGSEIKAGVFNADEFTIASLLFHQTFSHLHGATKWQDASMTLAGITLSRGLDLAWMTVDLSHVGKRQADLQFDLDTFGGKLRASFSNQWRHGQSIWDFVAWADDISLAQTSEALGFTDQLGGSLHAGKFTFHGNPRDLTHATASIWTEVTDLSWGNRSAELIMLGAALYNRQIQLQQLYVKQRQNELTLSGEGSLHAKPTDWWNPDFRGTVSASINDLGSFAGLFGAQPGDFAGAVAIEGTVNARNRKIGGHLMVNGHSLSIFRTEIDSFAARLNLKASEVAVEQLEIKRKNDSLQAQGTVDVSDDHNYSGTATATINNIADYTKMLPASWSFLRAGALHGKWAGKSNAGTHSGTLRLSGRGIRAGSASDLRPFDVELNANYSPGKIFFQQLHFSNEHASLNGFLTVAANYLQAQAIAFDLNGKPKLRGNLFIPLSVWKVLHGSRLLDALDPEQNADVDLDIEPTDLTELCEALTGRTSLSGNLAARLSIFGGLDALQGWSEMHLGDFTISDEPARCSADAHTRFASGKLSASADLIFRGCDPVSLGFTSQILLGKERSRAVLEPIAAQLDFPAIFLARLPRYLSHDRVRSGILTGKILFADTLNHPKISGDLQLMDGKLGMTPLHADGVSGRLSFHGQAASLDFAHLTAGDANLFLQGNIDFRNLEDVSVMLNGIGSIVDLTANGQGGCVNGLQLLPVPSDAMTFPKIDRIELHGNLLHPDWFLTLAQTHDGHPFGAVGETGASRVFRLCSGNGSQTLLLGCETQPPHPAAATKRHRRHGRHR